jgi:hypothetical protein
MRMSEAVGEPRQREVDENGGQVSESKLHARCSG